MRTAKNEATSILLQIGTFADCCLDLIGYAFAAM
jgi:hypothetical protein